MSWLSSLILFIGLSLVLRKRIFLSQRKKKLPIPKRVLEADPTATDPIEGSKCVVTGAGGFVGRALVEKLLELDVYKTIVAVDVTPLKFMDKRVIDYQGDILDQESIETAVKGASVVFHIAGFVSVYSCIGPANQMHNVNVVGTQNVINACIRQKVSRLLYISSTAAIVTADNLKQNNFKSEMFFGKLPGTHLSSYGITKYHGEVLVRDANGFNNLKTLVLRPNVIFGQGDRLLTELLVKSKMPFMETGGSRQGINYVHNLAQWFVSGDAALKNPGTCAAIAGRGFFVADVNMEFKKHSLNLCRLKDPNKNLIFLPYWCCKLAAYLFEFIAWYTDGMVKLPTLSHAALEYARIDIPVDHELTAKLLRHKNPITMEEAYQLVKKHYFG